jgi:hypothetical protein
VQCAYCEFGELVEIHADGTVRAIEPESADRYRPGTDPISTLPRAACAVKCGKLAIDGGFCEPCNRAWRIAGRPEPREQWAIHYADQLEADRKRTKPGKQSKRTPPPPEPPEPPDTPDTPPPPESEASMSSTLDSLSPNDKRRWSYVKKTVPGIDIEQWIADGKPKPTHYRKAAKARAKAPSKPVQRPVETASAPAVKQPPSAPAPAIQGELLETSDPLMDLASTLISTAAKRGGRCRVMILDLTLAGDSEA